jgi:murein DD-endopeptidase MepM/ murein hydrolase activator NlpD
MRNFILNLLVCSFIVGLMLINVYMSMPNRHTLETDFFLCVGEGDVDSVEDETPPPFLDTMYSEYCPYIHYRHDSTIDSITLYLDSFEFHSTGHVSSGYGWRWGRMHYGIDYAGCNRDTSRSVWDGVVRYAERGYNGGYGNLVVVRHFNGLETYYAHHWSLLVEEGDTLSAGDGIGIIGSTGRSTGPHLHFEVRFLGVPIDPDLVQGDTLTLIKDRYDYGV